jgi:hypothetical protein
MSITDDQDARHLAVATGDLHAYMTADARLALRTAADKPSYKFGSDAAALAALLDARDADAYDPESGWLLLSERVERLLDQQDETIAQLTADLRRAHARAA